MGHVASPSVVDVHFRTLTRSNRSRGRRLVRGLRELLAVGRVLPEHVWRGRHQAIVAILWANVVGLFGFALVMGHPLQHVLPEIAILASAAMVARGGRLSMRLRGLAAAIGMLTASALLVHYSGGYIEAHFHFFVAIMLIALYQDWVVFAIAILYVLGHHGLVGLVLPESVFNHEGARSEPLLWAGIHAGFVAFASVANVLAWRLYDPLQDPLTGLATRALFTERLSSALRAPKSAVAVLFVDLDGFKQVNDSIGHTAGDELLRLVARRVDVGLRDGDTAARLGGDEFALLLTNVRRREDALTVADRIFGALREPFHVGAVELSTGASVGIALSDGRAMDPEQLVRNADLAMYVAKRDRKGPRLFEPAMHDSLVERTWLRAELRSAILNGELAVHYQPILRTQDRAFVGVEALARWPHAARGMIPPAVFIPEAEEAGLIGDIGRYVLHRSLTDLARWRAVGLVPPSFRMRLNVSARELEQEAFAGQVARSLYSAGLPGAALMLEVTESVLSDDVERMALCLGGLSALGVRVSIDDFGSGYASYTSLRGLPVDEIKLDRALVAAMTEDRASGAIVRSIVSLAHDLDLKVVAEGIEDEKTLRAVADLGADLVQGYLLGRPMAADALVELMGAGDVVVVPA